MPTHADAEAFAGEKLSLLRATHNHTYTGAACFVKVFEHAEHCANEVRGLTFVRDQGLPSLPVLSATDRMLKLPLADPAPNFDSEVAGRTAALVHHRMPLDGLRPRWSEINEIYAEQLRVYAPNLAGLLTSIVSDTAQLPHAPMHGDMNCNNMVIYEGNTVVIDWEILMIGPSAYEFAAAWLAQHRFGRAGEYDRMVAAYESDGGIVDHDAVRAVARARALLSIAWRCANAARDASWEPEALEHIKRWPQAAQHLWG